MEVEEDLSYFTKGKVDISTPLSCLFWFTDARHYLPLNFL